MGTDNLKLLGALVAQSTTAPDFEKAIEDLIRAARTELKTEPKLVESQYALWKGAGKVMFVPLDT